MKVFVALAAGILLYFDPVASFGFSSSVFAPHQETTCEDLLYGIMKEIQDFLYHKDFRKLKLSDTWPLNDRFYSRKQFQKLLEEQKNNKKHKDKRRANKKKTANKRTKKPDAIGPMIVNLPFNLHKPAPQPNASVSVSSPKPDPTQAILATQAAPTQPDSTQPAASESTSGPRGLPPASPTVPQSSPLIQVNINGASISPPTETSSTSQTSNATTTVTAASPPVAPQAAASAPTPPGSGTFTVTPKPATIPDNQASTTLAPPTKVL